LRTDHADLGPAHRRWRLAGVIAGAGFGSGDRFVVGHWLRSPLGPMNDLMWATPGGERRLVAPTGRVADFVAAVYRFDDVVVSPLQVAFDSDAGHLALRAPDLGIELHLEGGRRWPIPLRRPPWVTRYVEAPVARRLLGVQAHGTTATGVREWYQASSYRRVVRGRASLGGVDLGPLRPVWPPTRFGFSEPPRRPSVVEVSPVLVDPWGRLDRLLGDGSDGSPAPDGCPAPDG
jgi:hypothetical protein